MQQITGILIVILAGIFQGSFILPMTLVKKWKWENTWLVFSFAGMIVLNFLLAAIFISKLPQVYAVIPNKDLALLALFGLGWGVGAVLFGIGMDKLGMALGYPIIMGLTASMGALLPLFILHSGDILKPSGLILMAGVIIAVAGIILCSKAATLKAGSAAERTAKERLAGGLIIAVSAGLLSSLPNIGFTFGSGVAQAARLGAKVSFVGKIGDDSFGHDFVTLCKKEGIDHRFVFTHEKLPTASGFIICAEGHNIITIDIGALNEFGKTEIDQAAELFTPRSVVLIQLEIPFETPTYAAQKAKENGAVVILNPAPAKGLSGTDLSYIDFLTPNETEARICAGLSPDYKGSDAEVARELTKMGCKNVIVTLGEKGSLLVNNSEELLIPAFKITSLVDSTGAGDAFSAAFAVAVAEGLPVNEAMLFGNAAGALACTKADTIPSFHNRQQINEFIKNI